MARSKKARRDELLPLSQAAPLAGVTRATMWRWVTEGREGVKLAAKKVSGSKGWRTTRDAIDAFREKVAAAQAESRINAQAELAANVREMRNGK